MTLFLPVSPDNPFVDNWYPIFIGVVPKTSKISFSPLLLILILVQTTTLLIDNTTFT